MEIDSVIIRKSPIILLSKMIITTLAIYVLFTLYSIFFHQEVGIEFSEVTGKILFLFTSVSVEALVMIILFLQWTFTTYEINNTEIIERRGVFWRRQEINSLKYMQAVYINQGFLGTLIGYGTLKLHNPLSKEEVCLKHIPDPNKYAHLLQSALNAVHNKQETIVPMS